MVGNSWFADENKEGFLSHMGGTSEEKKALACVLDSLDGGIHVRTDGVVLELEEPVVRLGESSCHPVLVSLWSDHGMKILSEMYGLSGEEADEILARQDKRKQGFGAFLRELGENLDTAQRLDRLPWDNGALPVPLSMADRLVRKAIDDGLSLIHI